MMPAPDLRLSYTLMREEWATGLKAVFDHKARGDKNNRFASATLVLGAFLQLLIIAVAGFLFRLERDPWLVVVLAMLVIQLVVDFSARWLLQRSIGISFDPRTYSDLTITIAEDGLTYESRFHREFWRWEGIVRVHLVSELIVLEVIGLELVAIPNRAFGSAEEGDRFLETVLRRSQAELLKTA